MHHGQRAWVVPLVLLLLVGAAVKPGSILGDAELPSEQVASCYPQGEESVFTGDKGVRRDCVLLEVFMRPT